MSKGKIRMRISQYRIRNERSEGYILKKSIFKLLSSICIYLMLFCLCFLILQPVLTKLSVSFMSREDLFDSTVNIIPKHFSVENYRYIINLVDYGKCLFNTAWTSVTLAVLQIASCTLAGYGLARFDFPFKKIIFAAVMLIIVVPPQTISTSVYLHFKFFDILGLFKLITGNTIDLQKTPFPYYIMSMTCMGLKNGLYIFMIRQYFRNVPKDVEEAAYVDGCGILRTFVKILLPDARPIISSCLFFAFVWQWTDSFFSGKFLGRLTLISTKMFNLSNLIWTETWQRNGVAGVNTTEVACCFAVATVLAVTPLLLIYAYVQRQFVESLSTTGIKM